VYTIAECFSVFGKGLCAWALIACCASHIVRNLDGFVRSLSISSPEIISDHFTVDLSQTYHPIVSFLNFQGLFKTRSDSDLRDETHEIWRTGQFPSPYMMNMKYLSHLV
jgi:hypothetical protein